MAAAASIETAEEKRPSRLGATAAERLRIRDATPADAGAIARIAHAALPATYRSRVDEALFVAMLGQLYSHDALSECITLCSQAPGAHFLVAESDGEAVGYLHFDSFGPRPELHRLYTHPALTGRGIGARLLDELETRLPAGTTYMLLVVESNRGAVRFYERRGFRVEERLTDGLATYREHMGVGLPDRCAPVALLVMSRTVQGPATSRRQSRRREEERTINLYIQSGPVRNRNFEPSGDGALRYLRSWLSADGEREHVLVESLEGAPVAQEPDTETVELFGSRERWMAPTARVG